MARLKKIYIYGLGAFNADRQNWPLLLSIRQVLIARVRIQLSIRQVLIARVRIQLSIRQVLIARVRIQLSIRQVLIARVRIQLSIRQVLIARVRIELSIRQVLIIRHRPFPHQKMVSQCLEFTQMMFPNCLIIKYLPYYKNNSYVWTIVSVPALR